MATRFRFLVLLASLALALGCGSGRGAPAAPASGRTGAAAVPGGVDARSANYRFVGGIGEGGSVSSSPNYIRYGGLVAATQ